MFQKTIFMEEFSGTMQNQYENQRYEQSFERVYQPEYQTQYVQAERPTTYTPEPAPAQEHPANAQATFYAQQPALFNTPLPHTDARFAAALTYSVGWLSGLLFVLFSHNRYVRFHALQSLFFFGAINLFDVGAVYAVSHLRHLMFFPSFLVVMGVLLINFIAFVGWLVGMFQAYKGSYYQMPVVGSIVASMLPPASTVK